MNRPEAPCKDCPARTPGCHSCCEKYLEFREDLDVFNALVRDQAEEKGRLVAYQTAKKNRMRKQYAR